MRLLKLKIKEIKEDILFKYLGYEKGVLPKEEIKKTIRKMIKEALSNGEAKAIFTIAPIKEIKRDSIRTQYGEINSSRLATIAKNVSTILFSAITIDPIIEDKISNSASLLEAFIWDTIGTVMIETAVESFLYQIKKETGLNYSLPFSPGYCDWDLSGQKVIFSALNPEVIGIKLLKDSFMMVPQKSISFVSCLGHDRFETNPCSFCQKKNCSMKRK